MMNIGSTDGIQTELIHTTYQTNREVLGPWMEAKVDAEEIDFNEMVVETGESLTKFNGTSNTDQEAHSKSHSKQETSESSPRQQEIPEERSGALGGRVVSEPDTKSPNSPITTANDSRNAISNSETFPK